MIEEAFGGERRIAATLTGGDAVVADRPRGGVAFRAGVFNVGAEGCFYLGGLVAAVIGFAAPTGPAPLVIPVALGAAALIGGLWLARPGAVARPARGGRGGHHADAELHRGRSHELAGQRPAARARLRQFGDARRSAPMRNCRG